MNKFKTLYESYTINENSEYDKVKHNFIISIRDFETLVDEVMLYDEDKNQEKAIKMLEKYRKMLANMSDDYEHEAKTLKLINK